MFKSALSGIEDSETIFCLLSGENITLPQAEVEAILESEGHPVKVLSRCPRILRLRSTGRGAEAIAQRAAYTRRCCLEIVACEAERSQVLKAINASQFHQFLGEDETFKVEAVKVGAESSLETKSMEGEIGQAVLNSVPYAKVNLERSDKTFLGVVVNESFLLGLVVGGSRSRFDSRRPQLKPFFHPSAMQPKLARCMVNLSRASPKDVFVDAFCGTGSLLIEAGLVGCTVLGSDIDWKMVRGTSKNLSHSEVKRYSLCVADARALPFRAFDSCASDPPYGRGSSTHGADAKEVVASFLREAFDVIASGGHICLAFPEEGNIGEVGRTVGYEVQESHLVREHKSLTREVIVLRRP